ncbi:hypothetical protein GNZ06_19400 [Aeromonas jandaei]|uniref:hypothetical protein n=1 Tax=Aeromonas jandaei TaxID=650 RepID=UPI001931619B|nr:hypothetical protein [Aeromonas jandaei]MBM0493194.1 hypothetical protein [Aeromonas jandaei]MBM0570935.1 hypothetical protein [Aeromonas jandaei]
MIKYWLAFIFSVIYSVIIANNTASTPFPAGVYTSVRYRASNEDLNTHIIGVMEVSKGSRVKQKITIKDDTIDSYAAFMFDGSFGNCINTTCEYERKGSVLLKTDISHPVAESKYLDLLAKAKLDKARVSTLELLFKNKDMVMVLDVENQIPYLYAVSKKRGFMSE